MDRHEIDTPTPISFGQLAVGAAHDLNNVISGIQMQLGQMKRNAANGLNCESDLEQLEKESVRAANLTQQVVLYVRSRLVPDERVNLAALSTKLFRSLSSILGENIELAVENVSEASWVKGDAAYLEQLIVNLCITAQNTMPNGGRIALRVSQSLFDLPKSEAGGSGAQDRVVCVEALSEAGTFDQTIVEHLAQAINEPNGFGSGRRWRFAAVCMTAREHGGRVETWTSERGENVFRICLPGEVGDAAVSDGVEKAEVVTDQGETILLVEDTVFLRRRIAQYLRTLGYAVFEAEGAMEARKIWKDRHETIQLLLTDMVMADLTTGLDLALEFRLARSSLGVIITSGDFADSKFLDKLARSGFSFLAKPYPLGVLAAEIRNCLKQRRSH